MFTIAKSRSELQHYEPLVQPMGTGKREGGRDGERERERERERESLFYKDCSFGSVGNLSHNC